MTIDFYCKKGSPPCAVVLFLAKYIGVDLNLKVLDGTKEENKSPQFLKINPQHTVPALDDNGFTLSESRAILGYLADQYGKDYKLYPKDAKLRAVVNQRLFFDIGNLYQTFLDYYVPLFFVGKLGDESKLTKFRDSLEILNKYLEGQNWVAGNELTIADFSLANTVTVIDKLGDVDLRNFKNVLQWLEKVKQLPGYENIEEGSAILKNYVNSKRK